MANRLDLPSDTKLANQVLQNQAAKENKQLEIGWMGHVFGSSVEKPGNIAGFAILVASVMLLLILFFGPNDPNFPKREAMTLCGSIITGALGFLFGRSTS